MDERTYSTTDKSKWGEGAWQTEPDKVQWVDPATGLDCLAVRGPLGAWCGYVGVPVGHPAHGVGYDEVYDLPKVQLEVHGGLTFADSCTDHTREAFGRWRAAMLRGKPEVEKYPRGDWAERWAEDGKLIDDYEGWVKMMEASSICHVPFEGRPDGVWWFGFDCAHAGDLVPKMEMHRRDPSYPDAWRNSPRFMLDDVYRDVAYVRAEVSRLAASLKAAA